MERLRTDDGAVIAYRRGDGAGTPVLLLHSLFLDGSMFDPILPALRGRPTLRPDHRGQGASTAGRAAATAERLAADMVALLDAEGIGRVHLAGSSMGGYVAMEVLRGWPDRVATLALSCCTCRPEADPARFEALAARLEAPWDPDRGRDLAALMFGPAFAGPDRADWTARFAALPAGTADVARAIFAHGGWVDVLRGWGGPVLAVSGAEDRAKSPADLAWIAAEGLGRHVVMGGVGHTPPVEAPGAYSAALSAFLDEHERVAA